MDSDSIPFINTIRTRVKASTFILLIGFWTRSFHVNVCRSSGVPLSVNKLIMGSSKQTLNDVKPHYCVEAE